MPDCPICGTGTERKIDKTPYWSCPNCQTWFQDPMPPKRWHGDHETWVGQPMLEDEKRANEAVAAWLFKDFLKEKQGSTLDIGASYPWLAHCLAERGCTARAIDGSAELAQYADELGVIAITDDFESAELGVGFDLITLIHTIEHLYQPVAAFSKLRRIIAEDGVLFIRMPDHQVNGIERDLTEGHYTIHPFVYCLPSILQLCAITTAFKVTWTAPFSPGQRDIALRPV